MQQDHMELLISASLIHYIYLPQTTVHLDEAKIREDARNVQHKCLQKDYAALKEENKTVRQHVDLFGYCVDFVNLAFQQIII